MAIQIGKYKRPGIFIEEFDRSVFTSPLVEGITNLVIGVSKKGPVNDLVRITNLNDLESIFGQLDRNLEKGWRLDYFITDNEFINKVQDSVILDEIEGSDHCPIKLILKT